MQLPTVPLPKFLQIEPVGQCNLRCRMCPIQFRKDGPPHGPPAFMDWDVFTRLLDQFPGLETLQLQGLGEPMMHPRFFDMVAHAAGRGIKVSTNSNLTLLSERRAEECVRSGLGELHASLDGATAATYEHIRVRAYFDRVVANLQGLMDTRRRLGSATPWVRIVMVIMRRNLPELTAMVELAHRLGIDTIFVQHLCHDFGESTLPDQYREMRDFVVEQTLTGEDPELIQRHYQQAAARARELNIDLRLPVAQAHYPPDKPGRQRCDWPWSGAYVSYRGQTMPCCMVSTPDRVTLGDMARESVERVWNGPAYQSFRAALDSSRPPEVCQTCSIYRGTF